MKAQRETKELMLSASKITICCLTIVFTFQGELRALDDTLSDPFFTTLNDPLVAPLTELPATEVIPASYASNSNNMAWKKGEFRIVPYGLIWGSTYYGTARSFPGAFTLFIPSEDKEGEEVYVVDTRRTRVGIDVLGPRIPLFHNAKSSGRIEIDFLGQFLVENQPGARLRHAYAEVKNDEFRLLGGQTWDIVSPLNPNTLNFSVGWGGGNIGFRRAQIRLERYLALSDVSLITLQGSLNQNIVTDFTTVTGPEPEASGWPLIEARMAITRGQRGKNCLPCTLGVSAHIGEQGFDFTPPLTPKDDARIKTWSFNVDMLLPINDRCGVKGEFFMGENLGTFLGGIVQGVSLQTRSGIRSRGGWFDFWYDLTGRSHVNFGAGIDDPIDVDVVSGRRYNHFIFANSAYDITKKMSAGIEVTSWKTLYRETQAGEPQLGPGESVIIEFMGKYNF